MERHTPEDEEYFNRLYFDMYKILYRYASRMCAEQSDIEDVLQETFKEAHIRLEEVKTSPNPKGYLMNVLKYKIQKQKSRKIRILEKEERLREGVVTEEEKTEDKIIVWDFCEKTLNKAEYTIILRRYRERETIFEISEELGITEGACKMRVKRSLAKLKKAYEKELKRNG